MSTARPTRTLALSSRFAEIKRVRGAFAVLSDAVTDLCTIVQGPGGAERIGTECRLESIQIGYRVVTAATAVVGAVGGWRFTVFQWNPQSSTVPTKADIFNPTGELPVQLFNIQRKPLYKILYDVSGILSGDGNANMSVGNQITGAVKMELIPRTKVISFEGGVSTVGNGHVYVLFQSAALAAADITTPTCNFNISTNFTDL